MELSRVDQKPKTIKITSDSTKIKKSNIKTYVTYCLNTSNIHGVKYIGESGRYLIEKVIWFCVLITVCSLCVFLISQTYVKWKTTPVIVSLETKETPISEIPFPAITICPEVKVNPEYFNITKYFIKRNKRANVTEREKKLFNAVMLVCHAIAHNIHFQSEVNESFTDPEFLNEVLDYAPSPMLEPFTDVLFLEKMIRDSVSKTITEEGFCLSFNMLPIDEILNYVEDFAKNKSNPDIKVKKWSLEEGYPPEDNMDSYPRRTFLSGFNGGVRFSALYVNHSQIDYLCEEGIHGFKVALHHPCELPNMDKHFVLPINQVLLVAIKPTMIKVSKELINYKPENRRCYFAKEKPLSLYKIYTRQNCLVECLTNYTLEHCGCVPFWIQYFNAKICGPSKNVCIQESKVNYLKHIESVKSDQCDCLPLCTSLSYDIETSYTNWNWREYYTLINIRNTSFDDFDPQMAHFSQLVVYYKSLQFVTSKRHELFGIIDLFSNVGGLLGLFFGFSLISVVEIIYLLTLRIICNIVKYGRKHWSGEPRG